MDNLINQDIYSDVISLMYVQMCNYKNPKHRSDKCMDSTQKLLDIWNRQSPLIYSFIQFQCKAKFVRILKEVRTWYKRDIQYGFNGSYDCQTQTTLQWKEILLNYVFTFRKTGEVLAFCPQMLCSRSGVLQVTRCLAGVKQSHLYDTNPGIRVNRHHSSSLLLSRLHFTELKPCWLLVAITLFIRIWMT